MRSHRPPAPAAARLGGGRSHGRGACRCGTGNGYAAGRAPRAPVSGSKLRPADATEERPRGTRDSPPARPPTHPKECIVCGDLRRKGCTLAGAKTYSSLAGTQQPAPFGNFGDRERGGAVLRWNSRRRSVPSSGSFADRLAGQAMAAGLGYSSALGMLRVVRRADRWKIQRAVFVVPLGEWDYLHPCLMLRLNALSSLGQAVCVIARLSSRDFGSCSLAVYSISDLWQYHSVQAIWASHFRKKNSD